MPRDRRAARIASARTSRQDPARRSAPVTCLQVDSGRRTWLRFGHKFGVQWMNRRNQRARDQWTRACALGLGLALATGLAAPASAQQADPVAPGSAAAARLDFATALDELNAAIASDPTAPEPRLARAALHRKMQRPALALADLGAVLETDPANLPALRARVDIWTSQRAWNRARADLDAALAAAPGNAEVLALRARVNENAGMAAAALADYDAARAAAPDDETIARARAALLAAQAERSAARVAFGPEAVMSDEFLVVEGDDAAPNTLHIVHAATALAEELAAIDTGLIDRAVDDARLRVVHMFTYTGEDASIWGNLALICAGPDGFAAARAALSDTPGQAALAAAGAGDFAPIERLLNAAYSVAGIDRDLVRSCALDRLHATRYLADWQSHRDAGAWRGINLLDTWPVWVLNAKPVAPGELAGELAKIALAPVTASGQEQTLPSGAQTDSETGPHAPSASTATSDQPAPPAASAAAPGRADGVAPLPDPQTGPGSEPPAAREQTDVAEAPAPQATDGDAPVNNPANAPPEDASGSAPPAEGTLAPVRFPDRPEPAPEVRVPVELRGIYAPSLAACLRYLEGIEDPSRIDAVLPEMNPLDGPALGTILVTSRRIYLFNPLDTECAIADSLGKGADWQGTFACASPLAPDRAPVLRIAPTDPDGSAPRVSATFATAAPVVLRQCRTLGQLGNAFAPLWTHVDAACSVAVPVESGRFAFSVDAGGNLILRVAPTTIPAQAGRALPLAVIDGAAFGESAGRWDGTGWQIPLGSFDAAAERLGWGMFLDVRTPGAIFESRLPLFGSSAAMSRLADCASSRE